MQLVAVLPYIKGQHFNWWATVSDSTGDLDGVEIPLNEIPGKDYDYHLVTYNLWDANGSILLLFQSLCRQQLQLGNDQD